MLAGAATIIGLVLLWPGSSASSNNWVKGAITDLKNCGIAADAGADASTDACEATVKLTAHDGADVVRAELPTGSSAPDFEVGDDVVLAYDAAAPAGSAYTFVDLDRSSQMLVLLVIALIAIAYLGRWDGVTTLVSITLAVVTVLVFVLPAIRDDANALWVAATAASVISLVSVFAALGVSARAAVTALAVVLSTTAMAVIGAIVTTLADFTTMSDPASTFATGAIEAGRAGDLVLAALIIGALGAAIEVATLQVDLAWDIVESKPAARRSESFAAALREGRGRSGAVIRTLLMAYAASTLPLLFYLESSGASVVDTGASGGVAEVLVMGLVGTFAILLVGPLATTFAVSVANASVSQGRRIAAPTHRHRR